MAFDVSTGNFLKMYPVKWRHSYFLMKEPNPALPLSSWAAAMRVNKGQLDSAAPLGEHLQIQTSPAHPAALALVSPSTQVLHKSQRVAQHI